MVEKRCHIEVVFIFRNYGYGDTNVEQEMKPGRNGKNEYIMRVNKKEVSSLFASIRLQQ
jgi:hypothetical protein